MDITPGVQDISLSVTTPPAVTITTPPVVNISLPITGVGGLKGDTGATGATGPAGTTDHLLLTNIGSNSHAQIDTALATSATHIANVNNPHAVTKAQVGLSNVPNTDFTAAVAANTAKNSYPTADANKLATIATGATVNSSDTTLLTRANHIGTQSVSTITGLSNVATSGSYTDLSNRPTVSGTNTGDQTLTLVGSDLTISGQNTVTLPASGGGGLSEPLAIAYAVAL
jgi:hypothetical protein